jgi:SAM-dependent methyltransferase
MNADSEMARSVYELHRRHVSVAGKDILEIGPGHTLEVLVQAIADGANSCTAVDVIDYLAPPEAGGKSVRYFLYEGKTLPFESEQFDVVWSHTAFEHLRHPHMTVQECFRVLRAGGRLVSLIDLGDHSFYGKGQPTPDLLFDCLKYPEWLWNLMKWNRSSYVNRLRKSEWMKSFKEAGFVLRSEVSTVSDAVAKLYPRLPYLHRYPYDDAVTAVLFLCAEKPPIQASHRP